MFAASKTASVSGGYQISRSLRFNSADSAYLSQSTSRSPASDTSITFSFWIKLSGLSADQTFVWSNPAAGFLLLQYSGTDNYLYVYNDSGGLDANAAKSNGVLRDVAAWYHIVYSRANSSNGTLYINGVSQTKQSTSTANVDFFADSGRRIGLRSNGTKPLNGYLTEFYCIDGQALTASSFGETNAQTGVWQPKAYSGSYGTNGFYLNFSDNSNTTSATLGKDYSGNGNNWTPNNFSVSAGAGNDSLVDSPTSYGTDTGVGGEVRGNYSTMNPLDNYNTNAAVAFTFANGNLDVSRSNQSWASSRSTMAMSSGKWYAEMTVTASTAGTLNAMFGIAKQDFTINDYFGGQSGGYGYNAANGQKYNGGSGASYGATFTTNDVIGVAYDADAGSLVFYKNGTSQGTAYTGLSGTFCFAIGLFPQTSGSITATLNCGQRPFAYTAPSGYKALCTQNLPTPTIGATTATQAGKYFNPVLYTGNGGTQSVTGVGFQPDFTWVKSRTTLNGNGFEDAVRGAGQTLESNNTSAEVGYSAYFTAFTSDGFNMALGGGFFNSNGQNYVAWNWKANGSGSTNTAGSITSTVSANTTSGFSIVTYTGTGSNATVGHGLGVAPSMVICKTRTGSSVGAWQTYHSALGATKGIFLNLTDNAYTSSLYWNNTAPTSSVFSLGGNPDGNGSGYTMVAYCFAEVAGYSKFGSYTGNGSSDGPFVFTGMKPAFLLVKCSSTAGENWAIYDATRDTYNVVYRELYPNASSAETSGLTRDPPLSFDFLSNGFKLRGTNPQVNGNGNTYIFMALAQNPFKYSLAR